jgi:UDP-3-O-[3-hydroxymyristoyl] glucosamine N-acyltransferase
MKSISIQQLKGIIEGEWFIDSDLLITGITEIEVAQKGDLVYAVSGSFVQKIRKSQASFAIVPLGEWDLEIPYVKVRDPYLAISRILSHMNSYAPSYDEIHPKANIHPEARLGEGVIAYPGVFVDSGAVIGSRTILYANAVIGRDCQVGNDCIIYPNVTIRENCILGNRVIIQPGAVVGSDGYGFVLSEGIHHKIPQLGHVLIEDDVEIGAGTTIDRGTLRATQISQGTKLDNLVQIGHNVSLGKGCLMASQSGISGSTQIEDYVTFGGQSGSVGHIKIGTQTTIMARGVATQNLDSNSKISGFPGRDHRQYLKLLAGQNAIPRLRKDVLKILKALGLK